MRKMQNFMFEGALCWAGGVSSSQNVLYMGLKKTQDGDTYVGF
jgi:hypothetical protein